MIRLLVRSLGRTASGGRMHAPFFEERAMRNAVTHAILVSVLNVAVLGSAAAFAQSGLSNEQRRSYARVFQAAPPGGEAHVPRGRAAAADAAAESPDRNAGDGLQRDQRVEYARVYRALHDLQERRTAVPADPRRVPRYVEEQRAEMARVMRAAAPAESSSVVYLLAWNHVALDASALDHSTLSTSFGEQFGPTRTSRAFAIAHLAMFEAVNAITRKHPSYQNVRQAILERVGLPQDQLTAETASVDRAIVEAAYLTLKDLYPEKDSTLLKVAYDLDRERLGDLPGAPGGRPPGMILGARVGAEAAAVLLEQRRFDGSELPDLSSDDFDSDNPRTWHQDPITRLGPALGGNWARVKPFVIASADAFRPGRAGLPTPPAFESPEFVQAYKEVRDLGGDPKAAISDDRWPTPTSRSGAANPNDPMPADNTNQTFVGIFWGYDGTALLCAPPRLYNMIATSVALNERKIMSVEDMSQYLALINLAMADAGIAAWDAKYHFLFPRPVTYVRAVSADDSPEGARNPRWTPLGAPVTNGTDEGRNLTPPFPAYPSGHAAFGGALFRAMTLYFQANADPAAPFPDEGIAFTFVSDEYNGLNRGPGETNPRKRVEVDFDSFNDAEELNARSRIYLGIHWQFDADHGIQQGHKVADAVFEGFVDAVP